MSVKIRCQKTGANNDPCFRIVATDIRSPRDGKSLETLGWYDPKKKDKNFWLNTERIEAWKKQGARPSPLVNNLMRKAKAGAMAVRTAAPPAPVPGVAKG
jgi:small subunit ribosomal protein S16